MSKFIASIFVGFLLSGCQDAAIESINKTVTSVDSPIEEKVEKRPYLAPVEQVLIQLHNCNAAITIRSQALTKVQVEKACKQLIAQENKFHQTFHTVNKPVADDNNNNLRINFYHTRDDYIKYANAHFNMPTDNGGMYLEGYPDRVNNHAEFVAYEKNGGLWNLSHEYVHYLDGRFNRYGDYCTGLHDDHAGPEFCPEPNLAYPHGVWWTEGLAEYLSKGNNNLRALKIAATQKYALSDLFNTSYNQNSGSERVYSWGYLAVRFMMEHHRNKIEQSLVFTRKGDWAGYQSLIKSWSTSLDKQWFKWLTSIANK
jgi:collagenase